jgi:adenine phosphoribosyltransferase
MEDSMGELVHDVTQTIRDIPDFPKPGILFKDITPVLADPKLFSRVIDWMSVQFNDVDLVVGIEARGFIFGAALVEKMGKGLVLARKAGKLPHTTVGVEYALEYGTATLEMHTDAIPKGAKVLVVDDLLATGGTAAAAVQLAQLVGADVVGCAFLVELDFLKGRSRLNVPVASLIHY